VISAAGLGFISVPQTIMFFFLVVSKSIALFLIPEVMMYFNFCKREKKIDQNAAAFILQGALDFLNN
jgi:hypothetical protein